MPAYPLVEQALRNQFVRDAQRRDVQKRVDPWEPGQRGRQWVNDWMLQNVAMPMYEKGYPQVGAYLTGIANTATDLALPETNEDAQALPFGAFKKGGKLMSNAVDMLEPEKRMQSLKRQNAIQAVREAIDKFKNRNRAVQQAREQAKAAGIKDDWEMVDAAQKKEGWLGMGNEMGAIHADGVVVKSPKFNEFWQDLFNSREKKLDRKAKDIELVQRISPEQARQVAQKDIDQTINRLVDNSTERFIMDQDLEYANLSPETFMIRTKSNTPYTVQERANRLLSDEVHQGLTNRFSAEDRVKKLESKIRNNTALTPHDLHMSNVGSFGSHDKPDYRVIDSGHFSGVPIDEAKDEAAQSWRFIDLLKK